MKTQKKEGGFILLIAIVWLVSLSLITVGILGMAKTGLKNEQRWVKMEECYMYAQAALSISRNEVIDEFNTYFLQHDSNPAALAGWYTANVDGKGRIFPSGASSDAPAKLPNVDTIGDTYPVVWEGGTYYTEITKQQRVGKTIDLLLRTTCELGDHKRTFEEHVVISLGSAVFKYAYFINNNGWFYGTNNTKMFINGDVRANANISLEGLTTFNGKLYAAKNPKLTTPSGKLVLGQVTDSDGNDGSGKYTMNNAIDYQKLWLQADDHIKARGILEDQELLTEAQIKQSLLFNPELSEKDRILEGSNPLAMPYLGELALYETDAKAAADKGWAALRYQDADGNWQINTTGVFDGDLVINGDFQIMGPFVVKGDLIIKTGDLGYDGLDSSNLSDNLELTNSEVANILNIDEKKVNAKATKEAIAIKLAILNGKGGFFVDRNINIIGDLKSTADTNTKDDPFLSLAARGNIIIGNTKDINQEWISPGVKFNDGQMVSYPTDDPMYQNSEANTAFDGNYAGVDAEAGETNAISIGDDNIHLRHNKIYIPGGPTGKTLAQKQERWLKTKFYTDNGEIIYEREYWKDVGEVYYMAGAGDEDEVSRPVDRKYEPVSPLRTRIKTWPELSEGHYEYVEDNNHLVVVSQDSQLLKTLKAKAEFAKANSLPSVKIEVDGELYEIDTVSNATHRYINKDGLNERGFDISISSEIPSADIPKGASGSVDRRFFETALSAADYSKLNPSSPSQIDAVLYTNHLIAGNMGLNASINGALVARDEAIKFKAGTSSNPSKITFNWDKRLVSSGVDDTEAELSAAIGALMPVTFDMNNITEGKLTGAVFQREIKNPVATK